MPDQGLSETARRRLAQSLPLLERRRGALTCRMEESLIAAEGSDEAFGQAEITAMVLMNLLIERARLYVEHGDLGDLHDPLREHRRLDIDGRHYSRFGQALPEVLDELLAPTLSRRMAAIWCDHFWSVIGTMNGLKEKVRA